MKSSILCGLERRRKSTLFSDLRAPEVEPDRDGDEDRGYTAEQGAGVLDAHSGEHLLGEKREHSSADTTEEGVRSDGGGGKL